MKRSTLATFVGKIMGVGRTAICLSAGSPFAFPLARPSEIDRRFVPRTMRLRSSPVYTLQFTHIAEKERRRPPPPVPEPLSSAAAAHCLAAQSPVALSSAVFSACRKRTNDSDCADRAFSDGDRDLGCKHFNKLLFILHRLYPHLQEKYWVNQHSRKMLTKITYTDKGTHALTRGAKRKCTRDCAKKERVSR